MQYNSEKIGLVNIFQEKRKSLSIRVFPNSDVVVKAPTEATQDEITSFIGRKQRWIKKQLDYFKQFTEPKEKEAVSGISLLYLGRQYQLIIQKSYLKNIVKVEKNKIVIYSSDPNNKEELKKDLDKWFLERAEKVFNERLKVCVQTFPNLEIPQLKIRKLKKRWGSYLTKHQIILNPMLIQAAKSGIDYIITHELCHFYQKEHNEQFFKMLELRIPQWKQIDSKMETLLLGK
ncbi:MAG: M48 family metallopeptidase [Alphaproteobacteria bacterium]|nr:M48 family metallopeptidase [Alphaproteobacteria bacterium]